MLHGRLPYSEAKADFHNTLLYKRKMFGRYGMKSNVNPGTLWPTQHEIGETIEYEQVAYPKSIQETVQMLLKDKEKEQNQINARQLKIAQNLKNLEQWKKDVTNRAAKKLAEVVAAKAKKDALIEEVRRHFGYKINPKDERFKELLMQKEKDQKKKLKEERAKAKQEKLLASMMKSES
ncbi:hypothetical protein AAG570_006704 [Ranatra chinensis]|uniref:Large ribosomal subunit protein mL64 n=1 Tax=Ranatra chinensis TaxID=642074 RepID=A0ABD0YUV8_9HEMI